jgi:hypothetical protein
MSAIKQKLEAMKTLLDGKIDSAPCFIAGDRIHAWEILKNKPGTAKIAVGFAKATARVNFPGGDITGRDNQYYYAIISRGRGLNQVRSDNLIYGSGGGKPLFELAEIMRDGLRALRFSPTNDEQPDYVSMSEWGLEQGFNLDAFEVQIWVGTQLPQLSPIASQIIEPI